METVRESSIVTGCLRLLALAPDAYGYKTHGSAYSAKQPDLVGACCGVAFAVECKVPGRTADPAQASVLRRWERAGAVVSYDCTSTLTFAAVLAECRRRAARVVADPPMPACASPLVSLLSPAQRAVALGIAAGHDNKTIALELAIQVRTVKAHLSAIYATAGVASRLELAHLIYEGKPSHERDTG